MQLRLKCSDRRLVEGFASAVHTDVATDQVLAAVLQDDRQIRALFLLFGRLGYSVPVAVLVQALIQRCGWFGLSLVRLQYGSSRIQF